MSITRQFCLDRADECHRAAQSAILAEVRQKYAVAEMNWRNVATTAVGLKSRLSGKAEKGI